MPKTKRLIKHIYDNTKKKKTESRLYSLLRQNYGFNYQSLCTLFKYKYGTLEPFFINAYTEMTLEDFDKVCSLCVNHKPEELLEMIKKPHDSAGIGALLDSMDNIKKIKEWYGDKRTEDLEKMLKDIIGSSTFEKRQDAIEKAKRKMNRVSFDID